MDSLKALLVAKKQEKAALVGDKKYVRKAELEEAKLKRLREEEEQERLAKEKRRRSAQEASTSAGALGPSGGSGGAGATNAAAMPSATTPRGDMGATTGGGAGATTESGADAALATLYALPKVEAVRRLRALGQPATLFGEDDGARLARLAKVEKDVALFEDEARGGQQENTLLAIRRQGQGRNARAESRKAAGEGNAGSGVGDKAGGGGVDAEGGVGGDGKVMHAQADGNGSEAGDLASTFAAAAAAVAAARAEAAMAVEDRIAARIKRWVKAWEDDLDARSDDVKNSGAGHQATMVFKQSTTYMAPLYDRLAKRVVDDELVVGLDMICQAIAGRNYLEANDIYLRLAIGNAPWPIGVTQVGIHERSAREKISHVMKGDERSGQAHIMNDEATRKYFQAIKRLITNMQRLYPTDPSRSIDFNISAGAGRGAAGGGSDKVALLEAEARGETTASLALPAAPHYMAPDGSVAIPPKWDTVLKRATEQVLGSATGHSAGAGARTPPRTPPRPSPSQGG